MSETYPGIEIRVRTERGEILNVRSDIMHMELMQMWLTNGWPNGHAWYPVGGTVLRACSIEIRAVDVPALPSGAELLAALEHWDIADIPAEPGDVGQAPDVDPAPGHRPCCCHAGFSGNHVCCIHPAEVCCVCSSPDVGYQNYRDDPFCIPCANGDPVAPAAGLDGPAAGAAATPAPAQVPDSVVVAAPGGAPDSAACAPTELAQPSRAPDVRDIPGIVRRALSRFARSSGRPVPR